MNRNQIEQIVAISNIVDGIIVTDMNAIVVYYSNFRPDVNDLQEQEVIGRSILEIHRNLKPSESSIMRVINTGVPIFNELQILGAYNRKPIKAFNTTLPIYEEGKMVGVVEFSTYQAYPYERQKITIVPQNEKKVGARLYTIDDIITVSHSMTELKDKILKSAQTESTVLIYGETGTGKELVAQSIHSSSSRTKQKFISQNCAAIPENLLEGILFGTSKGSYTDAIDRPGLFEIADGGTLFLDEINSMSLPLQAKILKALEEKKATRIGSFQPKSFNIKIIAAVNKEPRQCVQEGTLREDLFYRLGVVTLNIPSLRERRADIFYITEHYIHKFNDILNRRIMGITSDVEELFAEYSWPGNIRELKNCIEGAFNMCSSRMIEMKDIPDYIKKNYENELNIVEPKVSCNESDGRTLTILVEEYEKKLIKDSMDSSSTLAEAAKKLGISKQSLNYKIDKYTLRKK